VQIKTFEAMHDKFDGKIGAFSYLLFILLYAPCSAALSASFREVGKKWTLFMALWSTSLAYSVATIFYQAATFFAHPIYSLSTITLCIFMMVGIVSFMSKRNVISNITAASGGGKSCGGCSIKN
jgi:ferrous iron transport protein B